MESKMKNVFVFVLFLSVFIASGLSETTTSKPKTASKMKFNVDNLQPIDCIRSFGLIAVTLFVLLDKTGERFYQLDLIALGGSAFVHYFCPGLMFDYVFDGEVDILSEVSSQFIGCIFAGMLVMRMQSPGARTPAVCNSYILIKIIGSGMILTNSLVVYFGSEMPLKEQFLTFSVLGQTLYLILLVSQLCRFCSEGRPATSVNLMSRINQHLLVDFFIQLFAGYFDIAHPEMDVNMAPAKLHGPLTVTIARSIGILNLTMSLFNFCGLVFDNVDDKRAILKGKVASIVLAIPLMIFIEWKHAILTWDMWIVTSAFIAVPLGNALCALYIKQDTSQKAR